jgi:hypothetical protein
MRKPAVARLKPVHSDDLAHAHVRRHEKHAVPRGELRLVCLKLALPEPSARVALPSICLFFLSLFDPRVVAVEVAPPSFTERAPVHHYTAGH